MEAPKKVLMVCLGNICRSPIAEAVFQDTVNRFGVADNWVVDSAGIGSWHVGIGPDYRAISVMGKHGLPYENSARQIKTKDFHNFDYILGMDNENIAELNRIKPKNAKAKILLLGDFGLEEDDKIIEDPYYTAGEAAFEKNFEQCSVACLTFLQLAMENKI